ncbi:putative metal-dependent hydrolase [Paenibacillus sp. LHD-117]|uniref:YfiT family bacillithiol transferase n=1 Tax=Paenibacillus sp. LHD-117 TaxID=3071412 RepID=UPI0027E059AF|nr:putative metal-dependent hydrolase [Paenibacillus sp. LHD-117]MDQ6420581.1 putative metal-dependent hydrolase [Paenibacillus sp. LHD-117]
MDDIRFPIGSFQPISVSSHEERATWIHECSQIVNSLRSKIGGLRPEQFNVPYRPDGWTIKQIIHHMADNDMNAYLRFKRALTEAEPLASSYREDLFAELVDYTHTPVELSILLLEALHQRFVILLTRLRPTDFERKLTTPLLGSITLDIALQRFVWHNKHHISQIESFVKRMEW